MQAAYASTSCLSQFEASGVQGGLCLQKMRDVQTKSHLCFLGPKDRETSPEITLGLDSPFLPANNTGFSGSGRFLAQSRGKQQKSAPWRETQELIAGNGPQIETQRSIRLGCAPQPRTVGLRPMRSRPIRVRPIRDGCVVWLG